MNKNILSWKDTHSVVYSLADKISDCDITDIVAIARGGLAPARYLAKHLDVRRVYSIGMQFYLDLQNPETAIDAKREKPYIYQGLTNYFMPTDNILIVDDVVDSGESMTVAKQEVEDRCDGNKIFTCSLHYKPTSKFIPDFYGERLDEEIWLIYDWEL